MHAVPLHTSQECDKLCNIIVEYFRLPVRGVGSFSEIRW